jgi:hypothetical protein
MFGKKKKSRLHEVATSSKRKRYTTLHHAGCWAGLRLRLRLALHKDDAKPELPENYTLPHKCELCEWRFPNLNLAFLAYHIKAKHC